MPTVEFWGYSPEKQYRLMDVLSGLFGELDFHDDIVFVVDERAATKVLSTTGEQRPFMRLLSRSAERLRIMRDLCLPHSDVETVVIGFDERTDRR